MMKSFIFYRCILILGFIASTFTVFAQCNTSINTVPSTLDTINCGESIQLQVTMPNSDLSDDFSSGSLGSLWNSTTLNYVIVSGSNGCNTPVYCPFAGSLPASVTAISAPNDFFWFNGGPAGWLTTDPLDIGCTGTISLDYRHETQSPQPCDGPDQPNEGQYLEYRTNLPGAIWTQINYWVPVNSGGPIYQHCWNNYTFAITAAMISTGTEFRIGTLNTSGTNWDQWAISNVSIDLDLPCGNPYNSILTGPNIPANYSLDTITVTPLGDSSVYIVNVTNGSNSCVDTVTVYIEQPSIVASVIPASCVGSDTLDAVATITNRCTYTLVLRNYGAGGAPNQPGWGTGQPAPGDYNYVYLYRNGNPSGFFTMGSGGQNAMDTFPLPMTDGDLLETEFTGLGVGSASGNDCYYYIYDSQMAQVAATLYGPTPYHFWNMIEANLITGGSGYNASPWNAGNPQPTCTVSGGGGIGATCTVNGVQWGTGIITSVVINQSPSYQGYSSTPTITIGGANTTPATVTATIGANVNNNDPGIIVSCPVTTTYTYAWTNITTIPPSTNGLSNPNIPNPLSTVSVPTQYQVIATNNLNAQCVAIDTISVPGNPSLGTFDFAITSANPICSDGTSSTITFELSSATISAGNFNFDLQEIDAGGVINIIPYSVGSPFTFTLASPSSSGVYTYEITNLVDASSGCPISVNNNPLSFTINQMPSVLINTSTDTICQGNNATIDFTFTGTPSFDVTYDDGISNSTQTINATTGNTMVSPMTTTTYNLVSVSDVNCAQNVSGSITITVTPLPNAGVSSSLPICSNDNNIFPLQDELGGAQDLTGYWDVTWLPNPVPFYNFDYQQPMSPGIYTYTVVAAPCPNSTANVTVSLIPEPNAGTANNQPICINDYSAINPYDLNNMLIGADGGGFWCAGVAGGAPIANLIDPYTYGSGIFQFTYQVLGMAGCPSDTTTVTLTINPEPVVNTFSSNIPTVSQSFPISLTVDMASGTPPFTINLTDDDVPPNPYTLTITPPNMIGSVSAIPSVIPITTYSITGITDGNGCTTTSILTVPVTVDPYPIIDPFNTATSAVCEGTTPSVNMTLTQGEAPVTVDYTYNGVTYTEIIGIVGSVAPITVNIPLDITNLNNGTNTITIISATDNSGVPSPNNLIPNPIVITVNPNPVVTFGQDDEICFGQPAILEFGFLVGTAPFTVDYTINALPQTPLSFNTNGTQTHILTPDPAPGVNTYNMIQVTDVNGCQSVINATSPVTITVNPTPVLDVTVSGANPICVGQASALFFPVTSGTPPYNLSYLAGTTSSTANVDAVGNIVLTGTTQPVSPIVTTTYTLVSVTDAKGCVNALSNSAQLVVNELPVVDISGTTEICDQDVTQLYFNFNAGSSPWDVYYNVNGTPNPTPFSTSYSSDSLPVNPTTTTVYTVTSVNDINCSSLIIDAATVTVNPLPEVVVSGGGSICNDGSEVDVIITTTSGTPTFNIEYAIGINSELASNIGYQYIISTNQAGVYSVTKATDSKGCIAKSISGNATVNINPMPEANISAYPQPTDITNPLIYFIDQSLFHVSGVWDFGDGNTALSNFDKISHTFGDTGTYIVALEVMTDSGCVVTAYQTIIIDPAFIIYIPTAFTPNNDLYNDYFLPIVDGVNEYEFSIYDRFGNRVFSTDKTNEAWDGKVNNGTEYATAGHYVYNIIIIDFRGKERTFQGGLMLIR